MTDPESQVCPRCEGPVELRGQSRTPYCRNCHQFIVDGRLGDCRARDVPVTTDLIAFLNARLGEYEATVNEIHRPRVCGSVDRDGEFDPDPIWCSCDYPARALREVAAGRAILAEHGPANGGRDAGRCRVCTAIAHTGMGHTDARRFRAPCPTLLFLAAIYSDHPDYDQEWKP